MHLVRVLTWTVCLGMASSALAAELSDAAQAELKRLAGSWEVVAVERGGQAEDSLHYPKVTVVDDKILLDDVDEGLRIVVLTPDSNPPAIDVQLPDGAAPMESIYELTDDTWRLCTNTQLDGLPQRPTSFTTGDSSNFVLTKLKRRAP